MRIFVASSTAGLPEAHTIQELLESYADVVVWDQQIFGVSSYTLESLEQAAATFDFGIFVLTPDDLRRSGGSKSPVPRDNVIFELGLFIGSLGRRRTFLVVPSTEPDLRLPSDLNGLVQARYRRDRQDNNLSAALAAACQKIRRAIDELLEANETKEQELSPSHVSPEPGAARQISRHDRVSQLHYTGRLAPSYTGDFLRGAKTEITIMGVSLNSFIGYFDSRPESEVKEPVLDALKRGVPVTLLFLDPDSVTAPLFAKDRSDGRIVAEIRQHLERAIELRAELASKAKGTRLAIRLYSQFPSMQLKRVDSGTTAGRILCYHYLLGLRRPDIPYLEISKLGNPRLFAAYSRACDAFLTASHPVP